MGYIYINIIPKTFQFAAYGQFVLVLYQIKKSYFLIAEASTVLGR